MVKEIAYTFRYLISNFSLGVHSLLKLFVKNGQPIGCFAIEVARTKMPVQLLQNTNAINVRNSMCIT